MNARIFTSLSLVALSLSACGAQKSASAAGAPYPQSEMAPAAEPASATAMAADEGAPGGAAKGAPEIAAAGVRAGEWDDNANFRDFQRYVSSQEHLRFAPLDTSVRRFIVVRDAKGQAVPNCVVRVNDALQHEVSLTTSASGRALLFPRSVGMTGKLSATTDCQGSRVTTGFDTTGQDGVVDLKLHQTRKLGSRRTIDIAFVLDTTGSMSEEIAAVKQTIRAVAKNLDGGQYDVRIGLVEYKDKGDEFVTKVHQMDSDLSAFSRKVSGIDASGGGDTPEDANSGLNAAVKSLQFSPHSVARLAFLIGDAPPHLDYRNDPGYQDAAKLASQKGIQVFTIAASGMDALGQAVWRQVAQYTGGTNMFVLRGGAGPQSSGAGDAKSGCGGTHENFASGNLDQLIMRKIKRELKAVDGDPLRIAGLEKDENAKPCNERLVLAE